MAADPHNASEQHLTERLSHGGLRFTPQRREVYEVILQKRDHPTADEVFVRARRRMPEISHATVYNCLDALVTCGLVRQVRLQRGAARYCPNMAEHCHYYCDACGEVFDVPLEKTSPAMPRPKGFRVDHYDIAAHGLCAPCASRAKTA